MRVNGFRRAMIAATAMTALLGGCASTPRAISAQSNQSGLRMPVRASASPPAQQSSRVGSLLRHIGHALVSGVSWLFHVPAGVYGSPEAVAYSSAKTWKESTGTTGCTMKCDRVQRHSANPIN